MSDIGAAAETSHEAREEDLREEVEKLNKIIQYNLKVYEGDIKKKRIELEKRELEIKELKSKNESLEKEMRSLKKLEQQIKQKDELLAVKTSEIEKLTAASDSLKAEIGALGRSAMEKDAKISEYERRAAGIEVKIKELKAVVGVQTETTLLQKLFGHQKKDLSPEEELELMRIKLTNK